jgi:ligand-binding sensor domain-containing protein
LKNISHLVTCILFKKYTLIASACLLCLFSIAQPVIESSRLLSYPEGLSDRAVRDITQDSKGFLWVATDNGLNRFDGYRFQIFDNNFGSKFRIEESRLERIREVKNGKLALLNAREQPSIELLDIHSFKGQVIKLDTTRGIDGDVEAVFLEEKGDVWVISVGLGYFHFFRLNQHGRFEKTGKVTWPGFQAPEEIRFILGQSGHLLILDDQNGLAEVSIEGELIRRFDMELIKRISGPSEVPYFTYVLHEDTHGNLWVAFPFRQGIFTLQPGSSGLERPAGLPTAEVYSGAWEDKKEQLLLGTFKSFGRLQSLFLIDEGGAVVDYQPVLEVDEKINVIYGYDFTQHLFSGTFVGLNNINMAQRPIRWVLADRQLQDSDWDNGISIRSITGDEKGNIYISRELNAWYHLKLPSFEIDTIIPKDESGMPVRLWCCSNLVYDPAGFLWGGSCSSDLSGLLHRYELSTGKTKTYDIPQKIIRHLVRSRNGGFWLLCGVEGGDGNLLHFDPATERFDIYSDENGVNPLQDLFPSYLLESRSGKIWIGTDEGLVGIDLPQRQSTIVKRGINGLTNDNILVIHETEEGQLLLGTYGGINFYDPVNEKVEGLSLTNGLCNNTVCGILPDGTGNYWVSTFSGLSYFEPETRSFSNFFKNKGLTFNEFNRLAFYRDYLGSFYFGTLNGLNIFRNEDFQKDLPPSYPIQLTRIVKTSLSGTVTVQESDLTWLNELELSHNDVQVRLEFSLPIYNYSRQNRYAVWLEGIDENWRYLGVQNFLEISRLLPGEYKLRIKAGATNKFWEAEELQLTLVVKQVFYQTLWFQISLPVGILVLSYFFSRILIRRIRRRARETTIINKKFAEMELQALQSQMNPHFVFNALGAIQFFIQNNKAAAADEYLTKFAKLIRLFLECSKNKYITLEEEIKLLSLYVELEQMRFENKFHARIEADEEIDIHTCEIPSVLIQPFVENAINHGLFHKKSGGNLSVRFSDQKDGAVTCVIEDDGIGRKRAQALKEKSNSQHKSFGMQLVRERLEVLQHMDELKILFDIEDIDDQRTGHTGTRVTIKIPLMD